MQKFTIENTAGALNDFLQEHAMGYFDEVDYTYESTISESTTTCTKNGYEFIIKQSHRKTSTDRIVIDGYTLTATQGSCRICEAYVCDNAIVLLAVAYNDTPIIYDTVIVICKTDDGNTVVTMSNKGTGSYDRFSSSNNVISCTKNHVITSDGECKVWNQNFVQNNNNANILSTMHIVASDCGVVKDVYICQERPFYDHLVPFMLEINGESYASFAYNTILIKTT